MRSLEAELAEAQRVRATAEAEVDTLKTADTAHRTELRVVNAEVDRSAESRPIHFIFSPFVSHPSPHLFPSFPNYHHLDGLFSSSSSSSSSFA